MVGTVRFWSSTKMQRFEWLIKAVIYICCCLTALVRIPQLPVLTIFLRIAILTWLGVNFYGTVFVFSLGTDIVLANFIGFLLFLFSLNICLVAIAVSLVKWRNLGEIDVLRFQIRDLGARHLEDKGSASFPVWHILSVLPTVFLCEVVKLSITLNKYTVLDIHYLVLLDLTTYMRLIQIIATIMELNVEAQNILSLLENLVTQNKLKSRYGSDIWRPYTSDEYEQLNLLRVLYGQLYKVYGCVQSCFGWSMFMIIMEKFFFFVCTFFWCIQMLY